MTRSTSIVTLLMTLLAFFGASPVSRAAAPAEPALVALRPDAHASIATTLNVSALQPGKTSLLAIIVDVDPGHHAQSHTPLDESLIAFEVKLEPNAALTLGAPIYPAAAVKTFGAIGKVSVFDGRVIVYVPIDVKPDAPRGEVEISGSASFQICDDSACFPPTDAKFSVKTQIVVAEANVGSTHPDLFEAYKPQASVSPASQPSTKLSTSSIAPPVIVDDATPKWGLPLALGIAFIAGILFNIVPCVLPVLPIKVLGFAEVAQHDRGKTILLATIFGAGIVTVFAVLAVLILVLKTITWGQQFSNPWFAWGIVIVLLLLSMWLFGLLNVNLPSGAYAFTPRHDTKFGNYLWGILTAILSTPCTGPLFPPLMLWAQGQPTWIGVPAMMNVGVGMAFPYVLLSAFPEAARKFPRVGPWAELFKQMLGFVLLGFTFFFAAGRFTHPAGQWWAVVPVAGMAALYLMSRTVQLSKEARPVAISMLISISMVTTSVLVACKFSGAFDEAPASGASSPAGTSAVIWTPYSDDALAAARSAGKVVLIKFTANWCLNCQYVEATVYHDNRAIASLRDHDVVTLKADLTKNDALGWPRLRDITSTGGIPLTAIYAPGYDRPIQISSVYTTDTLVKTLDQLKK